LEIAKNISSLQDNLYLKIIPDECINLLEIKRPQQKYSNVLDKH
jgi:hypothetical protein